MLQKVFITVIVLLSGFSASAQTLEKMNWFNEPATWSITDKKLSMFVTPKSDYWRISHYGFTVDDAPFYYAEYGGEFEAKVKVSGDYKVRFDQAGMMIRIDHENYIKAGIEYVDGKFNISTVVTHHLDKGRAPKGCDRDFLFVRRQRIYHDAKRMDGSQPPCESRHDGRLS